MSTYVWRTESNTIVCGECLGRVDALDHIIVTYNKLPAFADLLIVEGTDANAITSAMMAYMKEVTLGKTPLLGDGHGAPPSGHDPDRNPRS